MQVGAIKMWVRTSLAWGSAGVLTPLRSGNSSALNWTRRGKSILIDKAQILTNATKRLGVLLMLKATMTEIARMCKKGAATMSDRRLESDNDWNCAYG